MADLFAEATRWRVLLPVGALKGIAETDARRLAVEHGGTVQRQTVRLYSDGTEVLSPWTPAPVLRSPADRAQDDLTDRLAAALADALSYIECGWLHARGLALYAVDPDQPPLAPMPGEHYWASGPSPRGYLGPGVVMCLHAVVYRDEQLAHDPHPDGGGVVSVDERWAIRPLPVPARYTRRNP